MRFRSFPRFRYFWQNNSRDIFIAWLNIWKKRCAKSETHRQRWSESVPHFAGTTRIRCLIVFYGQFGVVRTRGLLNLCVFSLKLWERTQWVKGCEEQILHCLECTTNHMPLIHMGNVSHFSLFCRLRVLSQSVFAAQSSRPTGDEQNLGLVTERTCEKFNS